MKNSSNNFPVLLILNLYIITIWLSSCGVCDCVDPCPAAGPPLSLVEAESAVWFEYYEQSEDTIYTRELISQRYDQAGDSIITTESLDTIRFSNVSIFNDAVSCSAFLDCQDVCEQIEAFSISLQNTWKFAPRLILTAGRLSDPDRINIEAFSLNEKSYRFSIGNNGENIQGIQVFNIEEDNQNIKYTSLSQNEIDRVIISQLDEFELDGINYDQCFEIMDSMVSDPNSPNYFRLVFNVNDGPILFEDVNSYFNPNTSITQSDMDIIKKLR